MHRNRISSSCEKFFWACNQALDWNATSRAFLFHYQSLPVNCLTFFDARRVTFMRLGECMKRDFAFTPFICGCLAHCQFIIRTVAVSLQVTLPPRKMKRLQEIRAILFVVSTAANSRQSLSLWLPHNDCCTLDASFRALSRKIFMLYLLAADGIHCGHSFR